MLDPTQRLTGAWPADIPAEAYDAYAADARRLRNLAEAFTSAAVAVADRGHNEAESHVAWAGEALRRGDTVEAARRLRAALDSLAGRPDPAGAVPDAIADAAVRALVREWLYGGE